MNSLIIFCAQYLFLAAALLIALATVRLNALDRRTLALRAIVMMVLCAGFAWIGGDAYHSTRPFARLHTQPLIAHAPDNGFPSDHTLFAAACAFLLIPYALPEAIAACAVTLIVAWARVACLLHSPTDVIGSIVFAAIAAGIARVLVRRKPKRRETPEERLARAQRKTARL